MTPARHRLAAARLLEECRRACNGDVAAAEQAAGILAAALPDAERRRFAPPKPWYDENGVQVGGGVALSLADERREIEELGRRWRNTEAQGKVLTELNAALSKMSHRGAALAILDKPDEQTDVSLLYGTAEGVFPVPAAVTEVGRLSDSTTDTATEKRAAARGKRARGKVKRQRAR